MNKIIVIMFLSFISVLFAVDNSNGLNINVLYKFEVAQEDEAGFISWKKDIDPQKGPNICERNHGKGWDVPTKEELNEIYNHRATIPNLYVIGNQAQNKTYYWSSTAIYYDPPYDALLFFQYFWEGDQHKGHWEGSARVRCVKR